MISRLEGKIVLKEQTFVVIDTEGVGYKVFVSPDSLSKIQQDQNEKTALWTHLAVRENALDLYGFFDRDELGLFEMLITVSGIGPKSAMGILSIASASNLRSAITSNDTTYLTKVSGIGKKNAEKIVLELKDKMGILEEEGVGVSMKEETEVIEGLKALGYSQSEAREALKSTDLKEIHGTGEKIKHVLKTLSN